MILETFKKSKKDVLEESIIHSCKNEITHEVVSDIIDMLPCVDIDAEVYCVVSEEQKKPIIAYVVESRIVQIKGKDNTYLLTVKDKAGQHMYFSKNDFGVCIFRRIEDAEKRLHELQEKNKADE